MSSENMVFRSVYVDHDVDAALRAQALQAGKSKGEMFREYLRTGMALAQGGLVPASLPADSPRLSLRTVYLPVDMDDTLRAQAFDLRTTKSDLIRQFLRMGMDALHPAVAEKVQQVMGVKILPRGTVKPSVKKLLKKKAAATFKSGKAAPKPAAHPVAKQVVKTIEVGQKPEATTRRGGTKAAASRIVAA